MFVSLPLLPLHCEFSVKCLPAYAYGNAIFWRNFSTTADDQENQEIDQSIVINMFW